MYCKNCGKELAADAKFCMQCGTPVDDVPAPVQTAPVQHTTEKAEPVKAPQPKAEPVETPRERPVFDEIKWNGNTIKIVVSNIILLFQNASCHVQQFFFLFIIWNIFNIFIKHFHILINRHANTPFCIFSFFFHSIIFSKSYSKNLTSTQNVNANLKSTIV